MDRFKRIIPKGSAAKPHWWLVTVGRRFTGTTKIRRFLTTEKKAKQFIADTIAAAEERGRLAFAIPQGLAVEAMELEKELVPHNATLTEAVRFFLCHAATTAGQTVAKLLPSYLETKANPEYRKDQKFSLRLFANEFGQTPINTIQAPAIEKWLKSKNWNPLNMRNHLRDVAMFFKWAKFHGHVAENPCEKIRRPKVARSTPVIFTVDEVRRLLETAAENPHLELLPMLAICFFSGVRVAEVQRMRWEMIDFAEGEIRLPGQITKTRSPRNIEIFAPLRWWLGANPPKEGEIVSKAKLRFRRKELFRLAAVPRKRNGLRHSFASFYSAKFRDPGALQLLLGQETPSVMFKHYIAATKRSDAIAFFDLRPQDQTLDKNKATGEHEESEVAA